MPTRPTREDRMVDAFLVLGSQYFALARYCAAQMYLPVSVTLFHHAVEMLLKGFLARSKTSRELKRFGHDLDVLWEEFKTATGDSGLARFDTTIAQLNRIELIRYPDAIVDQGYVLSVRLGPPVPVDMPGMEGTPQYLVNVSDLDEIATTVFKACQVSVTPFFKNAPQELRNSLPAALRPRG